MNTTIYYFLIYIAEALICIQYTSNIFSDRFSHFKTFIAIFILYSTLFIISLLQNPYSFFYFSYIHFLLLISNHKVKCCFSLTYPYHYNDLYRTHCSYYLFKYKCAFLYRNLYTSHYSRNGYNQQITIFYHHIFYITYLVKK